MKKFAILTSVLALTACGGGSGGGHSGAVSGSEYNIDVIRAGTGGSVSVAAAESNDVVTSMVSEIGVASDGSVVNIGRGSFTYNDKEYTSYKLDNVRFTMADEGFGGEMKFDVDENGEITKFTILADDEDDEDGDKVFERITDPNGEKTNKFTGQVRTEQLVDGILTYNSLGESVGLKYSDFGGIDIDVIDGWRPVIIGGYDVKRINPNNIEKNATFAGKATGSVAEIRNGEGSGTSITLDGDANLTFDAHSGASELRATFDNWYDMKYTENGNDKSVVLNNYTNENNAYRMLDDTGNGITLNDAVQYEYDYKDVDMTGIHDVDELNARVDKEAINRINSDIRYYGDANVPYESVGIVQVRDCANGICGDFATDIDFDNNDRIIPDRNPEVRMNLGFGVKR